MSPSEPIYTRPLDEKLGIRPGHRVEIVNVDDPWLPALVTGAGATLVKGSISEPVDMMFLAVDWPPDLERLPELRRRLQPDGAIWVVRRKGKAATLRDVDVIEAGIASGLVDNKVVAFSETHSAFRLVIRLVDRAAHSAELDRAARP